MPVTVVDVPELSRYEARVDGQVVGFADYHRRGDLVVFTHTEVDSEHEGQGVASALARDLLDDVRRRDLRALLRCPFLSQWASRHADYADVVVHQEARTDTG
jgi:predicted GNAT family acetyltransferase